MIAMEKIPLNKLPLSGLRWVRDLSYFEGPLLSEYRTEKQEIYLKHWCECNNQYHRWMYFKIKEQDRLRLVLGEKTLLDAINDQPDSFVFFVDENENESKPCMVMSENIPNCYMPSEEACLDAEDYVEDSNVTSFVFEDEWDMDELKDLYRKFTQVYDFIYLTKNKISSSIKSMPWQDGYSTVNFYNKLKDLIPIQDRSTLGSVHYASPGYMKLKVSEDISSEVLKSISRYLKDKENIDKNYRDLYNRIKDLGLNGMLTPIAQNAFDQDALCKSYYNKLCGDLAGFDSAWLDAQVPSYFERCKIVMAHYRRLKPISEKIDDSSVRAVSSLIN